MRKKQIRRTKRMLGKFRGIIIVRLQATVRRLSFHPASVPLTSIACIVTVAVYLFSSSNLVLASGSWNQTDWSGGVGGSTANQYSSLSNIDATTTGKVQLPSEEKFTNSTQDTDSSGWSSDYSYTVPTLAQSKSAALSSATTSITVTLPTTPTPGNTILINFTLLSTVGTLTLPSGYTKDVDFTNNGAGTRVIVLRKVAGVGESPTVTVSWASSTYAQIEMFEFTNIVAANPIDQLLTTTGSVAATSYDIGTTGATTQKSELAFALVSGSSSLTGAIAWNNSFTKGQAPPSGTIMTTTAYKVITTPSAVSAGASWSSSRIPTGAILTYKTSNAMNNITHETNIAHAGAGSTRATASSTDDGVFSQIVNVGDTNNYNLKAYVYADGSAVTGADAVLTKDGANVTTSYTDVGGGWYELKGVVAGSTMGSTYGVKVKAGETVYMDDLSLSRYQSTGTLTSNVYDTLKPSNWGTLSFVSGGTVQVKARSSNSAVMSGAPNFDSCAAISSGSDISSGTGGCVTDTQRYIQYEVTLTTADTAVTSWLDDITISFADSDSTAPTTNASAIKLYKSNGGTEVGEGAWNNSSTPYFSWTAGQDNSGGLGLKGYCLYLGHDSTGNPVTSKGVLGTSPVDTEGACQFAVSGTNLDLSTLNYLGSALTTSNDPYYLNIKAIDLSYNVISSSASFNFKLDNTPPSNPAYITAPSNFINTKTATLSWATSGGDAASDTHSGLAGLQYKIGADGVWYGDSHSGAQDATDLLTNDGSYTTQSTPDFANLSDGNNVIYFRTWDQAGNVTMANVTTVLKINTSGAPSSPRNLIATPSTNTQNSFAFSWIQPSSFVGQASNLTYCYTVNTQPTAQTCNFTAAGVTSVPAGAFATQPGANTFYVVAKDESSGINYATAASVDFTANTSAPGMPLNLDIADTSIKASNNWRLVLSWEEPNDVGAGVAKYEIYRSTNGTSFSIAGSTSGASYVDTGLQSQLYYYKVRACDSANNCGAYSGVETKTPTGRFTTPPELNGTPRVDAISTKKATISWLTERAADSKVAFGTSSGNYFPTESYNSSQATQHTIQLSNLDPGTTYFYVTRWTDEDGNTGQSSELSFATAPRPVVEDVTVPQTGLSSATVQYATVGASKVKLYYGKSSGFGGLVELNTSTNRSVYNSVLPDLEDGTKYFYKINTVDADGNEYEGTTLSFATPPAPRITNLQFQPIENEPSSSQKISWETNVPATSELAYGVSSLSESSLNSQLTTRHEVVIRGLKDDSTYRLVARSRDGSGNLASSDEQTFKTALDTRPPRISDIVVDTIIRGSGAEARGQIVVSWRTDEPATSQVAYGEGTGGTLSSSTSEDMRLAYEHIVVISDLSTSRVYHVEPRSSDMGTNQSYGEQQVAIIGRPSDSVLGIIVKALQQVFGIE